MDNTLQKSVIQFIGTQFTPMVVKTMKQFEDHDKREVFEYFACAMFSLSLGMMKSTFSRETIETVAAEEIAAMYAS